MAANYNYVKFQRGTLAAYNNLRVKDPDTLYFIYADANNQYGSLYLGDKLISGGEVSVVSSSMSDLSDTQLSNVQDGQILVYDSSTSKWKNFDLATAIEDAGIETGATVSNITPEAGETDAEALEDISNPEAGDIAFVGDNIYIYNGTEWREIAGAQEEIQQRNLWTAYRLYLSQEIISANTQEAQEKWDAYLAQEITGNEFQAYYQEHENDFTININASARISDLIGSNSAIPAVGDIIFAPDLKHAENSDQIEERINSIYQITSIADSATCRVKSLLQGTYFAEDRISNLETLVGQPASGNNPATGLHAVVAEKITATEANQLIATAVGNLNHLSYQKVDELSDIDTSANNADRYIYLVPQTPGNLNDLYDEYLVIDGSLEKMGQWGAGTLNDLETAVGNLEDIINGIPASGDDPAIPGLVDTVGNLNDIINGIPASGNDPAVPGLVDTVSDLNDIINGIPASGDDPAVPGLADRITALETAVGDLSQLYNYDAQNPISIVNTINEINERLVWSSIGDSENEQETPQGN